MMSGSCNCQGMHAVGLVREEVERMKRFIRD